VASIIIFLNTVHIHFIPSKLFQCLTIVSPCSFIFWGQTLDWPNSSLNANDPHVYFIMIILVPLFSLSKDLWSCCGMIMGCDNGMDVHWCLSESCHYSCGHVIGVDILPSMQAGVQTLYTIYTLTLPLTYLSTYDSLSMTLINQ